MAVLHLHGGAWRVGTPAMLDSRSTLLAARGYTVIQVQYRLLGQAAWPAPVDRSPVGATVGRQPRRRSGRASGCDRRCGATAQEAHIALMTAATLADQTLDHTDDDRAVPLICRCRGRLLWSGQLSSRRHLVTSNRPRRNRSGRDTGQPAQRRRTTSHRLGRKAVHPGRCRRDQSACPRRAGFSTDHDCCMAPPTC